MDLAGAIKHVSEFDAKFRELTKKVDEILLVQRRNNRKMMEGFKCIEKAFKLNCSAQMTELFFWGVWELALLF